MTLTLCLAVLACVIGAALVRPRGLPDAVVAAAGAGVVVGAGALAPGDALAEARTLAPTLAFLAAVLVLGAMADRAGLFTALGGVLADHAQGRPARLLTTTVAVAAAVTAVLSLDATVVLLTPVVLATALRMRVPERPHALACAHVANAGSLLLPVSNLSNLLALQATGLSFARFSAVMALPWAVAVAVQWGVLRVAGRGDLLPAGAPDPPPRAIRVPRYCVAVIALTLAGFLLEGPLGVDPATVAAAGALALAVPALARRRAGPRDLARAAAPSLIVLVLGLGIVVRAAGEAGLDGAVAAVLPSGDGLLPLLGIAAAAAVLANLVNNLPAVLLVVPVLAGAGPGPVLAALIGVNVGANLTYVGSLANLLWRRVLDAGPGAAPAAAFTRIGLVAVPLTIVPATLALWASLRGWGP